MKQTILISILVAAVLLTQCTKTENSMTITNISPTTVQAGSLTEVTLTGTNFEASVTAMLINVGGVNMQPNSATSTQILCVSNCNSRYAKIRSTQYQNFSIG